MPWITNEDYERLQEVMKSVDNFLSEQDEENDCDKSYCLSFYGNAGPLVERSRRYLTTWVSAPLHRILEK